MAQWLGQFSGHTHESKVEGAEDSLRRAVQALRSADSLESREKKREAVDRLAEDLLADRLKGLKARLAEATDARSGAELDRRAGEIDCLKRREQRVREGGVESILKEFGVTAIPAI